MPIYEYRCNECGKVFEELRKACDRDKEQECPECGSKDTKPVFSVFGGSGAGCAGGSSCPSCSSG